MTITSKSDTVQYEEHARMRSEKDEIVIAINPTFLRQILANHSTAQLDSGNVKKMKFSSDGFEHIIALSK